MSTVNKRTMRSQGNIINGIDAGGMMSARISEGYEQIIRTPSDGLQLPVVDRFTQFCRGNIVSQDWIKMISLLTGTVGTNVFYERKSGEADATGWVKHTLTNPKVYQITLSLRHRGYGTCGYNWECMAADPTKTVADMHAILDSQAAPTYIASARGVEITAVLHGALAIYHVAGLDLTLSLPILKASHDGDIGYTAVDVCLDGMQASGSISFQDSGVTSSELKCQQLLLAAKANLVLTVKQSAGGAAKTLTIANVLFGSSDSNHSADGGYAEHAVPFEITNDASTPLTLAGTNKILAIA